IVELLIAEVRTDMAGGAAALATEQLQSCFLESVQRSSAPCGVAIEARIAGPDRPDVAGERRGDVGHLHSGPALQFCFRQSQLDRIEDRLKRLPLQRIRASIPEESATITAIDQRRSV